MTDTLDNHVTRTEGYLLIEKRLSGLQSLVIAGAAFMLMLALTGVLGAAWISTNNSARVSAALKRSDAALSCYILPQIDRAQRTLPTLSYYRENPKELATQLALISQQRDLAIETWGLCPTYTTP